MLWSGIMRESCISWLPNVVFVRKKHGRLQLCTDFRKLNPRTVQDSYALPRIEDTLDSLPESKIFSTLDLRSQYYQVEIKSKAYFS